MLRDLGTLELADVFRFAIGYAEDGYPLPPGAVAEIRGLEPLFREAWPTSAELYLPVRASRSSASATARWRRRGAGSSPRPRRPRATARAGSRPHARIWREGFVGEALVRFAQETEALDASGRRHRGLLTGDDLAGWSASWEQPLAVDYAGHTVLKPGPWSQAPVFLQQLRLLEGFDLAALGLGSAELRPHRRRVREARVRRSRGVVRRSRLRRRAARRAALARVRGRAAEAGGRRGRRRASAGVARTAASPGSRRSPDAPSAPGLGDPTRRTGRHRATSTSPTGSGTSSRRPRAAAGSRARRSSPSSASASARAARCSGSRRACRTASRRASARGRRSRPRSSCAAATRTSRSARPAATSRISGRCTSSSRHAVFGLDLQAAIDAPNFHTEAFPSSFYPRETRPRHVAVEAGSRSPTSCGAAGTRSRSTDAWSLGRVSAAGREPDGTLKAAANPRGMQGYAVGR